ncbi:MAG: C25 family cysteine peptidase, partial [Candidatus Micrarchaeia archaeon]
NDLTPSYLLIVGGPRIVAFEEFATPLADAGGAFAFLARSDPRVPSDNAYGMLAAARYECVECHPDVAVGRLPDGWEEESDSPLLLGLLDAAIAAHASPPALEEMASVVSMDSYGEHLKHLVYEELGNEIVDAPPAYYADASGIEGGFQTIINAVNGANALFFSLHGSNPPGTQVYSASDGAGEYYVLTRGLPEVEGMDYTGKIVLTDACYGANPYRLENESLPLLFLNNGALAFVGSTTSALANRKVSSQEFDDEAEILALGSSTAFHYRILRGLRDGERIGDAVKAARSEMLAGVPADELTAVQYVLYGDPTLKTNG